jgi:hypothetical protein
MPRLLATTTVTIAITTITANMTAGIGEQALAAGLTA